MADLKHTEIKLEFVGSSGINPFIANVSSPRACMDASHISQIVSLLNPDDTVIKTGIEYELGKYINDVRTEHDCVVKAFIPKYKEYGVANPPVFTLIIEYEEDGRLYIDYIDVDTYRSTHGYFGYGLEPTQAFYDSMGFNSTIPKDTILSKTRSLSEDGSYKYGLNANMAFMSHPSVAEDGFVVSESFLDRAKFTLIQKRIINITKDTIPLNLYGDQNVFKFIPDIGEAVREDGMLCALRQRNDWFSISDMTNDNLRDHDPTFDIPFYVNKGSVVIDVSVVRGNYAKPEFTSKMTSQLDNYAEMLVNYYRQVILKFERHQADLKAKYGSLEHIRLTPRMHRFMTDCYIKVMMTTNHKNKLCYRKLPIDQYRIEVTTMSVVRPNLGNKISDIHAAKGVICLILPDEQMPVDEWGNKVDIITDALSTISRMNLGRAYQGYLQATFRDVGQDIIRSLAEKYGQDLVKMATETDLESYRNTVAILHDKVNPDVSAFIRSLDYDELRHNLWETTVKGLQIYYPPDNKINIVDVVKNIESSPYKPRLGKLTYTDGLGRRVTTKEDIRVCQSYFIVLEKIANDYSAVSSAKINNFGFPVKGTNTDKHRYPHSLTPVKILGETEVRIMASFAPPELVADLMDISLNPISHKLLVKSIMEEDIAFNLNFNIDRQAVPYGNTKSLSILHHMFNAAGFDFMHEEANGTNSSNKSYIETVPV